jgi:DNA-binding GntR family transcriptional regulator
MLVSLREKAYVVRYASWQDLRHAQETVEIHEQMIEALRRRDLRRYRRLVDEHVRGPRDLYMSRLVAPPPARAAVRVAKSRRARPQSRRPRHAQETRRR